MKMLLNVVQHCNLCSKFKLIFLTVIYFEGKKFSHHHDINTYIKEYRQEKLSELKDENSSVESYGLAEITKAYEDLGISKCNNTSRYRNTIHEVKMFKF